MTDIPVNLTIHYATRVGSDVGLCGADLNVPGSSYTTRAQMVTCSACLVDLPPV